jgi:hypothetical protein
MWGDPENGKVDEMKALAATLNAKHDAHVSSLASSPGHAETGNGGLHRTFAID